METKLDPLGEAARRSRLGLWVAALRPEQWVKNLVVFAGALFGLRLLDPGALLVSGALFAVFCAASSATYLLNDVVDRKRDRQHPKKRFRAIASGEISPGAALTASLALGLLAVLASARLGSGALVVVGGYVALNLAYSSGLKHVPIVDVILLSIGFVLRAVGGAVAIDVAISPWLVLCTFMGMLFLALAKRRAEVATVESVASSRPAARGYTLELLDQMMTILVAATIVCYCVYTLSPDVREKFGVDHLYATVPFVVYGVFRYLALTRDGSAAENPARLIVSDRPLVLTLLLWVLCVVALLYSGAPGGG
jgi:4-hydroxybenzoate polyprenyltransferase